MDRIFDMTYRRVPTATAKLETHPCHISSSVALVLAASIYVMTMYPTYIGYSAILVAAGGAIMAVVVSQW